MCLADCRLLVVGKLFGRCNKLIKIPQTGDFYFFDAQNNDHSHPTPVHKNSQLAKRTRIISCLLFFVWRASQAGASTIATTIAAAIMYFTANKILNVVTIVFYIPYFADAPRASSILNNWLYLAMRSVRDMEPVLICPAFVATAKSAIVVSSVSPLRCEITTP